LVVVLAILSVTVVLIVTEWLRIDLVALLAMLALVWTGVLDAEQARSGFASNAVMAIIGVMILGRGLYKSGVTERLASFILNVAGEGKRRVISTVSVTVGIMSGFMQNLGAAALFLPVLMGISKRQKIPVSNLLMPMGFAALLGGTLTMVGTSSLIVLNDLLSNRGIETFSLFTVFPIGVVLLAVGILYFLLFGSWLLPTEEPDLEEDSTGETLLDVWGLSDSIYTFRIGPDCELIGDSVQSSKMGSNYGLNVLRAYSDERADFKLWEDHRFEDGQYIVVQGRSDDIERFRERYQVALIEEDDKTPSSSHRGYLEVVIPARSNLVGRSIREAALGETYNAQVVLYFSESEVIETNVADREVQAGDTLVLHGKWENLQFFEESEDFITVSPFEYEAKRTGKAGWAVGCFAAAIGVVFATDLPISMGFLTGAIAMILLDILTIEEAYRAIEWKVVFLISGLIPIGIAMKSSGTAAFIGEMLVQLVEGLPAFVILFVIGLLTTFFSLIMSNVAATVLLVPLVLNLAGIGGLSEQALVLQVGVCAANSFILPTHHVNALLMTPGGYQIADYLRAGSILSILFLLVSTSMIYLLYI